MQTRALGGTCVLQRSQTAREGAKRPRLAVSQGSLRSSHDPRVQDKEDRTVSTVALRLGRCWMGLMYGRADT